MPKSKLHSVLLAALVSIRETLDSGDHLTGGICHEVRVRTESTPGVDYLLHNLMREWPNASRDRNWPVPSMRKGMAPVTAYVLALNNRTIWDQKTAYGRVRKELLVWLIEELQK